MVELMNFSANSPCSTEKFAISAITTTLWHCALVQVLQDEVPHKDLATVQSLIEDAYGVPFNQVFEKFDPKPLGAASIGQVETSVVFVMYQ
jgi:hypothetical protein